MIEGQLASIRLKMSISKEYEDMVYLLFHSPHGSEYGARFLVLPTFDFEMIKEYLYLIETSEAHDNYIVKIPGGIYTVEEINALSLLVEGKAVVNNVSKNSI